MTTPFPFVASTVLTAAQMNAITTLPISTKTASYTAVASDAGSRIVMNVASGNTVTINNSVFAEGDTIFISNKGAGATTVTAGAGVTINTSGSLTLATSAGGTLVALSASTFGFFSGGAPTYGTATGGIGAPTAVTISSVNYEYLTFNATGTLTVTRSGFFDYLAIGGGGGAQSIQAGGFGAGGGGGGQVVFGSVYLSANQTVTIGAGSAFRSNNDFSAAGSTSIAAASPFTQTAFGNLSSTTSTNNSGTAIYVGGGAGSVNGGTAQAAFTETVAIGFRGGNSSASTNGAGGGGQSARGGNGSSTTGGTGGAGVDVAVFIGGSSLFKAQGGGGGTTAGGAAATNGVAGSATTTPPNGAVNTGQGGGGGAGVLTTGNGGSGICYIRYTV